jgi:glycosyltransferase involved in cell wall biosynthesis
MAIESFDLSEYDLIISSSWAVAKGVKKREGQLHISYCYTPIRYAWDLYDEYTKNLKQPKKFFVEQSLQYIRKWDISTLSRVDYFIADSNFVKERIQRTYHRDAAVIYPPVATEKFTLCEEKEDFYLTTSRLVPYKKTKLIVEAFNEMPDKRLIVIGDGEEYATIAKIAKPNITLLGYQEEAVLIRHMQKAKAFVYAAVEDFGIVLIEAMSCGTPVIALDEGATHETIKDGFNGIHFKEQNVNAIIQAVYRFEATLFDPKIIAGSTEFYAIQRFKKEIFDFIKEKTS